MRKGKKFRSIAIPGPLFHRIEEKIKGTEFDSVSSYVTHVVRKALSAAEEDAGESSLTKEEEQKIKERLKSLGYLG